MQALAFKHEHQNIRGPCEEQFRWEDDEGYVPTQNARGVFGEDSVGRRPGIYTFLAGPPNSWSRAKVNHDLGTTDRPNAAAGSFDAESIMLYRFESFFCRLVPSPCAPKTSGIDLWYADKEGLGLLCPDVVATLADIAGAWRTGADRAERRSCVWVRVWPRVRVGFGVAYEARAVELVNATLEQLGRS